MLGKILGYNTGDNTGMITGNDGKRYGFKRENWKERNLPQTGTEVDFEPTEDGIADGIYM